MMISSRSILMAAVSVGLVGCEAAKDDVRPFNPQDNVQNITPPAAGHEHGPNGGHVLELGAEEFHAEVTMDRARKLTVYLLDEAVKNPKPAANGIVLITTKAGDQEVVLELTPAPLDAEKDGQCSRFELAADKVPGSIMDIEGLSGDLTLKVGDKTLKTSLTEDHDHDHDNKDHDHDHDHDHDK